MSTTKTKPGLSRNQEKKIEKALIVLEQQNQSFDRYYSSHYGEDRWYQRLKPALSEKGKHVALVNRRADFDKCKQLLNIVDHSIACDPLSSVTYLPSFFPNIYIRSSNYHPPNGSIVSIDNQDPSALPIESEVQSTHTDFDGETKLFHSPWPSPSLLSSLDSSGLFVYYPLDYASLIPVLLLNVQPQDYILDLCAAPGGKSLAIAQLLKLSYEDHAISTSNSLDSELGFLECNDISPDRKLRLVKVLRNYLPPSCLTRTHVNLGDATKHSFVARFGSERNFDRILLDAPCSSERHLLQELAIAQQRFGKAQHLIPEQAKEYMNWTVNRTKTNAERQLLLLWNALSLCREGGRVVYSTCALSPLENDGVIEKLIQKLEKKKSKAGHEDMNFFDVDIVPVEEKQVPFGERTRYGWQILPDNNPWGWGPIYTAVIRKSA